MTCTDKFGVPVAMPTGTKTDTSYLEPNLSSNNGHFANAVQKAAERGGTALFEYLQNNLPDWSFEDVRKALGMVNELAKDTRHTSTAIEALTLLNDRRYSTGNKKRNHVINTVREALSQLFGSLPCLDEDVLSEYRLIDFTNRELLRPPQPGDTTLVINTRGFPPEGDDCDAALLLDAYILGWRKFICYDCSGQRFTGCGLGPQSDGVVIDVYGSSGDYLGSGLDGLTINVHDNAQDQVGQIIKAGKVVIYGDTGQTFMYGAKGGSVYVMGNAAGRPLINSVGRPRVVINGTCLDFLAESFMAGDVLNGGGFVILNGVTFDDEGHLTPLREPYPGSNLFSLGSGGAIYIRDPQKYVGPQQLNGGEFFPLTIEDWEVMLPYLEENERLFGIKVDDLLTVDGVRRNEIEVYRKVAPVKLASLSAAKK